MTETVTGRSHARRVQALYHSPWVAPLAALAEHPDGIYFGNGNPARDAQPVDRLRWASDIAWREAADVLSYGEMMGYEPLRELICQRMRLRGIEADPASVLITNGGQQGIDLATRLLVNPGDAIIIEGPTYIGALQAFDAYEPRYVLAPVDQHGIMVEELRAILDRLDQAPKFLYTVPTFQNPTGMLISAERRTALLELMRERGITIVEDDPYGEIYFGERPVHALRADDPSVIYIGSFSKTMAPGLRVGWMVAPPEEIELLGVSKEGVDVNSDRLTARTIYHAANGFLDDHVAGLRDFYRARRDTLVGALREELPAGIRWSAPEGGFFVWLELPEGGNSLDLLQVAGRHGVVFLPGGSFFPFGQEAWSGLRLGYSAMPVDRMVEGTRRLGIAIEEYLGTLR